MDLNGTIALVTGANRGLGARLVDGLLARGAGKVYAAARQPDRIVAGDPRVVPLRLDLGDQASVDAAAELAGDLTLLVNNAGIMPSAACSKPTGRLEGDLAPIHRHPAGHRGSYGHEANARWRVNVLTSSHSLGGGMAATAPRKPPPLDDPSLRATNAPARHRGTGLPSGDPTCRPASRRARPNPRTSLAASQGITDGRTKHLSRPGLRPAGELRHEANWRPARR